MSNKTYYGHDGIADAARFNDWVMSAPKVKRLCYEVSPNLEVHLLYRFKDVTIDYWGSGDDKDGAPVEIRVEGDTSELVKEICATIEKNFPGLRGE